MTDKQMPKLSYDERLAFATVRKTIKRRPEFAAALLEDMSKEVAVAVLIQARDELATMQAITRAFSQAAGEIVKATKETNHD
jgi:hypothetical protein